MVTKAVLGFAFGEDQNGLLEVLLIAKRRGPPVVVNRLNGLGGKIETGESSVQAMIREFSEEAGLCSTSADWRHVLDMSFPNFLVNVFTSTTLPIHEARTMTDEWVRPFPVSDVSKLHIVPNLQWLVPVCLDATIVSPFVVRCV